MATILVIVKGHWITLPCPHDTCFLHYNVVAEEKVVQSELCRFLVCSILSYLCCLVCLQRVTIIVAIFNNILCSGIQCQLSDLYPCYYMVLLLYVSKQNVSVYIFFSIFCQMLRISCMQVTVRDNAALECVCKKVEK